LLLLLFNFENKTKNQPFVDGTHWSHTASRNWDVPPKPTKKDVREVTRNGCASLITCCNVQPDKERMATADLGRAAMIFNHQSRPSATVLQKHSIRFPKLPTSSQVLRVSCIVLGSTRVCFLHSLHTRMLNKGHHAYIFCAKPGTRRELLLD
jgi:hypothetical protein